VGLSSNFGAESGVSQGDDIIQRHLDTPQTRPSPEGRGFGGIFRAFLGQKCIFRPRNSPVALYVGTSSSMARCQDHGCRGRYRAGATTTRSKSKKRSRLKSGAGGRRVRDCRRREHYKDIGVLTIAMQQARGGEGKETRQSRQ
jgi:hypothetical protein